jgi:hypothetical protein
LTYRISLGFRHGPANAGNSLPRTSIPDPLHQLRQVIVEPAEQAQRLVAQLAGQLGSVEQERLKVVGLFGDAYFVSLSSFSSNILASSLVFDSGEPCQAFSAEQGW